MQDSQVGGVKRVFRGRARSPSAPRRLEPSRPTCQEATRSAPASTAAFTLIEVLIALALAVILISVTASTLGVTLRAERDLDWVERGRRMAGELQTELYLTGGASNTAVRHATAWTFTATRASTGPATNRIAWDVWEITPRERPSATTRIAVRAAVENAVD